MFILLTSFLFLFTTSAKNPNWDATVSMKAAAMGSVFRDCYLRTDEIDSLCITTVMTHTARQEACTVTVDWTHPMEMPTPKFKVVVACEPTGLVEPWCRRKIEDCAGWSMVSDD
ncbi:hypothetical protein HBH64_008250 [Parastagonospora nodorum]|nr:hypothetical protein HBH51_172830 [Parastagonospora nodorum]KAH4265109.1 hypothetical protein HBI03_080660 [Parastagonospora nodorum]KAH4283126.1 hypothetical protein HBI04_019070 [Parastagonospora nodorum]KAH4312487.1 hypothetical protein HBI01_005790 [Parastagonospora nodorum]KAH4315991.1 hypothetical protein HBI02_043390 [Parastagonospora nodorum]